MIQSVPEPAAIQRTWHAIAPDGAESPVTFSVGIPVRQAGGEWAVEVRLIGLEPDVRKIRGEDGWQAMALGMNFIAARVDAFSSRGWQFFWDGDRVTAKDLHVSAN